MNVSDVISPSRCFDVDLLREWLIRLRTYSLDNKSEEY